jgi:hypothetical protein
MTKPINGFPHRTLLFFIVFYILKVYSTYHIFEGTVKNSMKEYEKQEN